MDVFKNQQPIVDFHYNNPHQYMSFIKTFKHAIEHNTRNITQAVLYLQVQVAA